jgi:tetratricopeptide (TPR) repeat protein
VTLLRIRIASGWLAAVLVAGGLVAVTGCKMAADGQNLQGVRLYRQGQYNPALQQFQKAVAADPKNADAHYNMAATLHHMGSQNGDSDLLNQAEALYNQCLDLNENHTDCHRGLAVLLVETGRTDRAFNLMKNWVNSNPSVADARIELARLYEEYGDVETAKVHLNQAVMIDQHNSRAWAALGRIREQLGDHEQALANYQRSWNLNSFQSGVAERMAALNRALQSSAGQTPANDTRTVTTPSPPLR